MNKKTAYYLTIGAFLCCVALIICGVTFQNNILFYAGIVLLFGGGFLLSIVCAIVMFARARKQADKMDEEKDEKSPSEKNSLLEEDDAFPSNRYSEATSVFAYTIHGYRHAPVKQKILMILFLLSTVGCCFVGVALLFFRQMLAAYICFGIFGCVLVIALLFAIITSIRGRK